MGVGGQRVLLVSGGGSARRDGRFANRPYDGEWESWGCDGGWWGVPRPAHLWIPAFAGTTMGVWGPASAAGVGLGSPALAGRPFESLRVIGIATRPYGVWGRRRCDGGWWWGCPTPRTSGYRLSPVRRLRVCGPASAAGVGVGGPAAAGRAIRESPLRCVRGVGNARGGGWGVPRPAHLWIPAFAGTTTAGERVSEGCWWRGALRQAQGERGWEARVRWGVGDAMGDGDAPRRAPLDTGFRRYDDGGGGLARAAGGGRAVPLWWDGRFANRPYDGVWGRRRCDGGW